MTLRGICPDRSTKETIVFETDDYASDLTTEVLNTASRLTSNGLRFVAAPFKDPGPPPYLFVTGFGHPVNENTFADLTDCLNAAIAEHQRTDSEEYKEHVALMRHYRDMTGLPFVSEDPSGPAPEYL